MYHNLYILPQYLWIVITVQEKLPETPSTENLMALSLEQNREIVRRLAKGESIRGIAKAMGCGISTVQRLKKKLSIHPTRMNTPSTKMNTPNTKNEHSNKLFGGKGFGQQMYVSEEYQRLNRDR